MAFDFRNLDVEPLDKQLESAAMGEEHLPGDSDAAMFSGSPAHAPSAYSAAPQTAPSAMSAPSPAAQQPMPQNDYVTTDESYSTDSSGDNNEWDQQDVEVPSGSHSYQNTTTDQPISEEEASRILYEDTEPETYGNQQYVNSPAEPEQFAQPLVPAGNESPTVNESSSSASSVKPGIHFKRESDQIADADRVIRVLDAYRALTASEKSVAAQFVLNSTDVDTSNEPEIVVKVINSDAMLGITMKNIREMASEKDRVERVFMVLRLPDDQLDSLGEIIQSVSDSKFETTLRSDRIGFAKEVEAAIDSLENDIVSYISATEGVLAAASDN
jgi:hypothetical protein